MDEGALRRPFGGPAGDARSRSGTSWRPPRRPTSRCASCRSPPAATPAGGGAFTLLSFPESDLPDLVYLEQLTGALYIDKHDEVVEYDKAMDALGTIALSPADSLDWLAALHREM